MVRLILGLATLLSIASKCSMIDWGCPYLPVVRKARSIRLQTVNAFCRTSESRRQMHDGIVTIAGDLVVANGHLMGNIVYEDYTETFGHGENPSLLR